MAKRLLSLRHPFEYFLLVILRVFINPKLIVKIPITFLVSPSYQLPIITRVFS